MIVLLNLHDCNLKTKKNWSLGNFFYIDDDHSYIQTYYQ